MDYENNDLTEELEDYIDDTMIYSDGGLDYLSFQIEDNWND